MPLSEAEEIVSKKQMSYRDAPQFDHMGQRYCDGYKMTGYWKGVGCCAIAKYKLGQREFCGAHFAVAFEQENQS